MTKEKEKYTTLDIEQCKWWVNTLFGMAKEQACNSHNFDDGEEIQAAQDKIIKVLEHQPSDCKIFGNKENCFGGDDCKNCDYKIQALDQPNIEVVTKEEVAEDVASQTIYSTLNWYNTLTQLENCGYHICKIKGVRNDIR